MAPYFWDSLEEGGARAALLTDQQSISYLELVERIQSFSAEVRALLPEQVVRPLVLLEAANEPDSVIAYLTCLRARWPVILTGEGQAQKPEGIASTYEPNVVIRKRRGRWQASLGSTEPAPMASALSVLLSTSGSTGAAKLVRLSADNLAANAAAIADYLQLSQADRAITSLPFHYSYGMSVLHTHLACHAGVVLTSTSLLDAEFWSLARRHEVTSLALVPTQFELLDKITFSKQRLPSLRYVTQAGGRLDPQLAGSFARLARSEGIQFFIMYGQTEAGPRMSYVPAEDAEQWCHSIGRPIPGGKFRLMDAAGEEIHATGTPGELVFEGANVMLGYAQSRADLDSAAGPPVLKTGDIAERLENGYFKIVGRSSRFIKLFGLRVALDEVELGLRAQGHRAYASGNDEKLVVFVVDAKDTLALAKQLARQYEWPERVVEVVALDAVPLLSSGKVDYRELGRRAARLARETQRTPSNLEALLRSALRTTELQSSRSFVEHGGDSLAYLEVQLFLSNRLGSVPEGWEHLPLSELFALESRERPRESGWQRVPADLIGRNIAITAVIALHSTGWKTGGGSILLLILVGYSLARFQSEQLFTGRVGKTLRSMLVPIVVLYFAFIALAALKFSPIDHNWFLLIANFREEVNPDFLLPYWYVNAYAQIVTLSCLPFVFAPVRKVVKRAPFEAGLTALIGVGLVVQLTEISDIAYYLRHRHPIVGLELLLCGWCMFFAGTLQKKLVATAAILLVWLQNYGLVEGNIAVLMLGGSLCTLWGVRVSIPGQVARALLLFGSLSMFVYLAHVPALYGLSRFLDYGALRFLGALIASLAFALVLKKASDLVVYRLVR